MVRSSENYNKELTYETKCLIKKWREEGKKLNEIKDLLDVSVQRISYTIKTFNQDIFSNRKQVCGRKCIIIPEHEEFLRQKVEENRFISGPQLATILLNEKQIRVSAKTAKRLIQKYGFSQRSPRKVPLISKKNQEDRRRLSKEFLLKPKTFWNRVIWSDETIVELFRTKGKLWAWRFPNEAFNPDCTIKTVKGGGVKIILWGCMNKNGVGNLVEIKDTLTGPKYVKLLQENLFDSAQKLGLADDFIFQQDNDPKHTSNIAIEFFDMNSINMLEWPSQSPDLNVIEHMWSELKRRYANLVAKSKTDMLEKLTAIWIDLGKTYCTKLVDSIYDRCIEVMKNKGGATRY